MTVEAVVGENAPQIRVAIEQDAEQVIDFALEPVGAGIDRGRARDRRLFVGRELDADAAVQPGRQKMIDDFESLLALGIIHAGNIDDRDELSCRIVAQKPEDLDDAAPASTVSVSSPNAKAPLKHGAGQLGAILSADRYSGARPFGRLASFHEL